MDVTRHNFKKLLPDIEEAIQSSSFVCIDGEFTGLHAYRGISAFDLPDQRYDKLQESSRQFLLVQFGLCTFHYNPDTDSYSNQAYNFYVWPRPCSRQAPDPRFLCQTSSLDFLISQDFDFNKLFRDGISYLKPSERDKLRSQTVERQEFRRIISSANCTPEHNIAVPPEQEGFLQEVSNKLNNFINNDKLTIEIDRSNAFQRRLVYQTAKTQFPTLSLSSLTRPGGERVILVSKDLDNQKKMVEQQDQLEIADLEDAFGFSKVIQIISESKKLVVGHNMVLDLCHTLNQFCSPLPQTYPEFKALVSTIFPNILDTKLMASTIPFKDEIYNSSLSELHKTVTEKPYSLPTITQRKGGCGYTQTEAKYHEAGYDAFITGLCFISMHRRLARICELKPSGVDASTMEIRPFLNKLHLMKVSDVPYMNICGDDILPDRSHVFHLDIPPEWKTQDVVQLFSAFGGVNVSWINDTSVFVSLRERAFANTVTKVLQSSATYTISSYEGYLKRLTAEKDCGTRDVVWPLYKTPVKPLSLPSNDSGTKRSLHSGARRPETVSGITPTLERTFKDVLVNKEEPSPRDVSKGTTKDASNEKKRPVSPGVNPGIKRSKSVVEEKAFDEPPWE